LCRVRVFGLGWEGEVVGVGLFCGSRRPYWRELEVGFLAESLREESVLLLS
jgi:hypothetical protein